MTAPRVLLVEDSKEDVLFFRRAVAQAGWECVLEVAVDGQEAIRRLSATDAPESPTHAVLDLKMPRVSGLEVLAWIRAHPTLGRLPVAILTSSQVASDVSQAEALGIDAFLVKPVSFKGLLDIVRSIGERWKIPVAIAGTGR